MARGFCRTIVLALVAVLMPVCVWAGYPLQVKDARGKLITISGQPQRIVSISPAFTEVLYSLKLDSKIVGVTRFCNYPKTARKKPKVGDMNTSAEAVLALKPDLVVALAYANDAAVAQLDKLGLTVFTIDPKTIEQTMRDIRTVGRITGSSKAAEAVVKQMKSKIATAGKQRAGKPKLSVLAVVQPSPLWAAGPKTFVDEMIRLANAENVARDARPGFVTFSKELAISRNPDVIVVGQRREIDYFLKSPQWRRTNAVKNKRVYVINSDLMMRAGPRLADGLLELTKKLNGS